MAQRRMFSKTITNSDPFLDMPATTQTLYFHLGMNADDDGFVQTRSIMRQIGSSEDDLKLLIAKGFLIIFADGVIVITAWKMNNEIRTDRYKPTYYQEHLKTLKLSDNKCYSMSGKNLVLPNDNHLDTQVRIGKDRIGKDRIEKNNNTDVLLQNPVGFGKEEINSLIGLIRKYNDGIVDGKQEEQRRYGKMLFDKLESIESVKEKKYTSAEILEIILKIVSKSEYHSHKIVGPKKIYYALGELMQICKQEIKKENKSNVSTF